MTYPAPLNTVIIGVGSNINPQAHIRQARKMLAKHFRVSGESKFVRTKPIGLKNQNDYLNGAVLLTTSLTRSRLKSALKKIEFELGRRPQPKNYGPRTIDLDILVWNGQVIGRDFYTRSFIRESVLELMPGLANGSRKKGKKA